MLSLSTSNIFPGRPRYFRTKIGRQASLLPGLERFPGPVQALLAPEIEEGQTMARDGDLVRPGLLEDIVVDDEDEDNFDWGQAQCDCRFYRKWKLPCRHLFHHHFVNNFRTLTSARFLQRSER